ncbi:MAG TPA: hypothetical protein VKU38_04405 [Ktedonobacteraceae bacterium]|nr:hypothetical protein [Ktedonobacteraceae bacterium]
MRRNISLSFFVVAILSTFFVGCNPIVGTVTSAPVACLYMDNDIIGYHSIPPQGIPASSGTTLKVVWSLAKPSPQALSPDTPRDRIQEAVMYEALYGPFSSPAAINNIGGNANAQRGTVLASSKPVVMSGCKPQSSPSTLTIPKGLKPGYYDLYLAGTSTYASGSAGTGSDVPVHVA